jgi:hypothetical protein
MRSVVYYSRSILLALLAVLGGYLLAPRIGAWLTLAGVAALATLAAVAGGHLLKTSTVSKITWKNRLAGFMVPWGWKLANGKLGRAQIASAAIWTLLGGAGVMLASGPTSVSISSSGTMRFPNVVTALLALAWIIDGAAVVYLLSTMLKNFDVASPQALSLIKVMALCVAILLGSLLLWTLGHPYIALLIAGGPPMALAVFFGLFIFIMLTAGKNVRWN